MDEKILERGVTHPTIHLDFYAWLQKVRNTDFDRGFMDDHGKSFADAKALMMWAWSASREQLAQKAKESEAK